MGGSDADAFLPLRIMFKSQSFLCPIDIMGVASVANGGAIPNNVNKSVSVLYPKIVKNYISRLTYNK